MSDAIKNAQERYQECLEALRDQRKQIEEDLAFSDPSNPDQWDPDEKTQRESDPGGSRPCLVMDQTGQYVANVAGQVEQMPPAIHAVPVDGKADVRVAQQLDGFFRHIEYSSRGQQHYARASTSAARAGVGYLVVRPSVVDRALNYVEPRISSEGDPLRVVFDPWSQELDGSDADCGWLLTPMSETAFERQFGKDAEKVSFGDEEGRNTGSERKDIVVAEQWIKRTEKKVWLICQVGGEEVALTEVDYWTQQKAGVPLAYIRTKEEKTECVYWSRMSGAEVFKMRDPVSGKMVEETVYPASGIGIVPMYGYVGWKDGRMRYCGIPRRAREPQRAYNFHVSELRAHHDPYLMPLSGIEDENMKQLWDKARAERRAFLPYKDWDPVNNRAISAPTRDMRAAAMLQYHSQGAESAKADIQAAIGMYQANLGAPSNETSGVAIESRKQQGEASTAVFPANRAASLTQVGRLCIDMIPRLIDTKRQLRILGLDSKPGSVVVNPQQAQAVEDVPEGGISINPNIGRYDARVVVGASFATQRSQTAATLNEVMARNPGMSPAIAPAWARTLDIAEAETLSEALTAMAPPEVRAVYEASGGDQQVSPAALKAQLEQMGGKLKELAQLAQEAQQDADEAQAKLQEKEAEGEAREDEVAIKSYDAFTKRLDMLIKAVGPQAAPALAMAALPAETPEGVRMMLAQTIGAAMAQPQPTDEAAGAGMAPETMEAEMPMEPEGPTPEMQAHMQALEQFAQGQEQLMQGLGQLAQTMGQLVKLVQAKRIRTPERGEDGLIGRVVDEIDPETFREMPAEGPVQ